MDNTTVQWLDSLISSEEDQKLRGNLTEQGVGYLNGLKSARKMIFGESLPISDSLILFSKQQQRVINNTVCVTKEEFIEILNNNKPKEIFNRPYSLSKPCWVITEYLGNNKVKYYAKSWVDKTPTELSMESLYKSWSEAGLSECFIEIKK